MVHLLLQRETALRRRAVSVCARGGRVREGYPLELPAVHCATSAIPRVSRIQPPISPEPREARYHRATDKIVAQPTSEIRLK
jgi:hypothetical protein